MFNYNVRIIKNNPGWDKWTKVKIKMAIKLGGGSTRLRAHTTHRTPMLQQLKFNATSVDSGYNDQFKVTSNALSENSVIRVYFHYR